LFTDHDDTNAFANVTRFRTDSGLPAIQRVLVMP